MQKLYEYYIYVTVQILISKFLFAIISYFSFS